MYKKLTFIFWAMTVIQLIHLPIVISKFGHGLKGKFLASVRARPPFRPKKSRKWAILNKKLLIFVTKKPVILAFTITPLGKSPFLLRFLVLVLLQIGLNVAKMFLQLLCHMDSFAIFGPLQ